jgi:dihydroorotase
MIEIPALIDPHVHFRTPGAEYKENWISGAKAALAGGVTTVIDMPNTTPPGTSHEALQAKKALIDQQLAEVNIPLRYGLYQGVTRVPQPISPIAKALKMFMGSSTGGLLLDDPELQRHAFQRATESDMLVAIHGEEEAMIRKPSGSDPSEHSRIRSPEVAAAAVRRAIGFAEEFGTRLYILHVSSEAELNLIRDAKARGVQVFAEATPHHLFLTTEAYKEWGTLVQVNPPLRDSADQAALWEAVHDGTIDTVGSDHAPHILEEKQRPYGEAPSGVPGIEWTLPLLMTAHLEGRLSLERIIELTHLRPREIFRLQEHGDEVTVSLEEREVGEVNSRCGWSPYKGMRLRGWPTKLTLRGNEIDLRHPEELAR